MRLIHPTPHSYHTHDSFIIKQTTPFMFDTGKQQIDWKQVQAVPHPKILVIGDSKCGKTRVAAQIAQQLLCPRWVAFTDAQEHYERWSESIGSTATVYH